MHRIASKRRNRGADVLGFTMVELLAAIAIIIILSGLGIGAARYASHRADHSQARSDMERIAQALERYRVDHGAYPKRDPNESDPTNWSNLAAENEWEPPFDAMADAGYMSGLPKNDPWGGAGGQSYQYRRLSRFSFQLRSLGPDGDDDTEDDIVWPF